MGKKEHKNQFEWADADVSSCDIAPENDEQTPDIDAFFTEDEGLKKDKPKKRKRKKKKHKHKKESKQETAMAKTATKRKYRLGKKKFKSTEDILEFLNNHYLETDNIAETLLEDKYFYGFLKKKNSRRYEESVAILNVVKEKIEKK